MKNVETKEKNPSQTIVEGIKRRLPNPLKSSNLGHSILLSSNHSALLRRQMLYPAELRARRSFLFDSKPLLSFATIGNSSISVRKCIRTVSKPSSARVGVYQPPLSRSRAGGSAAELRDSSAASFGYNFLNNSASPCRRSWVTHSSATPPHSSGWRPPCLKVARKAFKSDFRNRTLRPITRDAGVAPSSYQLVVNAALSVRNVHDFHGEAKPA